MIVLKYVFQVSNNITICVTTVPICLINYNSYLIPLMYQFDNSLFCDEKTKTTNMI